MKQALTFSTMLLFTVQIAFAEQRKEVLDYINKYKDIAVTEMVRSKIPASVTLAQGIHESNCGRSPLASNANNHFGIKCKDEWDGKKFYMKDDAPNECFRVYEHAEASYADHSDFLLTRPRYAGLFQLPITDYKGWANGLKSYGYATNPKYAQILINTIEEYNLDQYDHAGLAMIEQKEKQVAAAPSPPEQSSVVVTDLPASSSTVSVTSVPVKKEKEREAEKHESRIKDVVTPQPVTTGAREEYVVNGMRALKAQKNEDPFKIAFEYNMDFEHVVSFNDIAENDHFKEGEYIFLQAKRNRGNDATYKVLSGESMRDISQKFGVKLGELYRKNLMQQNDQPYPGEIVYLQEKRTDAPRTMAYSEFLKTQNSKNTSSLNKRMDSASK